MPTSYPQDPYSSSDIVKGDYTAGQAFVLDRLTALIDLMKLAQEIPLDINLSGGSTSTVDPSWANITSGGVVVPQIAGADMGSHTPRFTIVCSASVDAGTGKLRVQQGSDTLSASDEVTVTNTSPQEFTVQGPITTHNHKDRITVTLQGNVDNALNTLTVTIGSLNCYWAA